MSNLGVSCTVFAFLILSLPSRSDVIQRRDDDWYRSTPFPWKERQTPFPREKFRTFFPWEKRRTPFPWEEFRTLFPWEERRTPFPWEEFRTLFPWEERQTPFPWDRYTNPQIKFKDKGSSGIGTAAKVIIVIAVILIAVVVQACKYCLCSTNTTTPTLHAPPRAFTTATPNRTLLTSTPVTLNRTQISPTDTLNRTQINSTSATFPRTQLPAASISTIRVGIFSSATERPTFESINSSRGNYVPTHNSVSRSNDARMSSSDKPPDYFRVILDDLTQQDEFPEVQPTKIPDTPPPSYSEKTFHI